MRAPKAYCQPCKRDMATIKDEPLGQIYRCEGCGIVIVIGDTNPPIVLDRMPAPPPATTLNGGCAP
jgi:hypothetical protein